MKTEIAYIVTQSGVTAIIAGEQYTLVRENPSYQSVIDAITSGEEEPEVIADLFRTAAAVKRYTQGRVEVRDGVLYFGGEEVNNVVTDRILAFMTVGLPVEPLIAFLERLLANPSRRSIQELYPFLEHGGFPITPDGCFLGYKGVQDNYLDVHSGTYSNRPGETNEMPRGKVDDDFRLGCSYGFHVGTLDYAVSWGPRTVIVKVDPADVVSVPEDCNFSKLRTSKYEVVSDYEGALDNNFVAKAASPYSGDDDRDAYEDSYRERLRDDREAYEEDDNY